MGRGLQFILLLCCLLCLAGCVRWTSGSYQTMELHEEEYTQTEPVDMQTVSGYSTLLSTLRDMVTDHQSEGTLDVSQYDGDLEAEMDAAILELKKEPIPSYAVRYIRTSFTEIGARRIATVTVDYLRTKEQVEEMRTIWGVPALQREIWNAMEAAKPAVTILMHGYSAVNMNEVAAEYYESHMDSIMECPVIGAEIYPGFGSVRILELKFRYTHTQQELLDMRRETQGMLTSAAGYVRGVQDDKTRAERLYALLRPLYLREATTATPIYSLLCVGEGDSRSIALVYRMLCAQAGMDCRVVEGTLDGQMHTWNLIRLDDSYYHVDIHSEADTLDLHLHYDDEMEGYQWDAELYPPSQRPEPEPDPETEPGEEPAGDQRDVPESQTETAPDESDPSATEAEPTEVTEPAPEETEETSTLPTEPGSEDDSGENP